MQRHTAFAIALGTAHLSAPQTSGALDTNTKSAGVHGGLLSLAHGATESDTGSKLLGDSLCDQLSVSLRALDLEDIQLDLLAGELFELTAHALGLRAIAPDNDARASGVKENGHALGATLDLDGRKTGALQILVEPLSDLDILTHELGVLLLGVPAGLVIGRHTETETMGIDFLAHVRLPSRSRTWLQLLDVPTWPSYGPDGLPWAQQPR